MSIPFRFSILTCNLWNTEKWELRKEAVAEFLSRFNPDICCFQEIRRETMNFLDGVLASHSRVEDNFNGWINESNIYYKKSLFEEMEHGEIFLDMPESDRRLFWIKLKRPDAEQSITICTVHLTHQNNIDEQTTGLSYRHGESLRIAEWLKTGRGDQSPLVITGDFNDPLHPSRILSQSGLTDAFLGLGLLQPSTFPNPVMTDEIIMNESIDRVMSTSEIIPVLSSVPDFYFGGAGLSDHKPVVVVYEME